jgi:GH15 family glucan-1,4-alpha-glucosidase
MESTTPIADYGLISSGESAALVSRRGSIDWLCLPRFDSPALFAGLLGEQEHGCWTLAPSDPEFVAEHEYCGETLILERGFATRTGALRVLDFMPTGTDAAGVVRIVEGITGRVEMELDLRLRFDYGATLPQITSHGSRLIARANTEAVYLDSSLPLEISDATVRGRFAVSAGERETFSLCWRPRGAPPPEWQDADAALTACNDYWLRWTSSCSYVGEWRDPVVRALLTLKALIYAPTGAFVAAPTTSLPAELGGERNWDYRYSWLRDGTIVLLALVTSGYLDEANAWRDWLLRTIAKSPNALQVMYTVSGEHPPAERQPTGVPGYAGSSPVRIGNAAAEQFQLDIYGEVMNALHVSAAIDVGADDEDIWPLQCKLVEFIEQNWRRKDAGIWEMRGEQRHFVQSKVMAWVGVDRGIKAIENTGRLGPLERWRRLREEIHTDVCAHGFNDDRQAFTQYYGGDGLDASALLIPLVGFLPLDDVRVRQTVAAIEQELLTDGLVHRYRNDDGLDGIHGHDRAFIPCGFWLVDYYAFAGRQQEARELFTHLLSLRNHLGLLAEGYGPDVGQLGNFPLALSQATLILAAHALDDPNRLIAAVSGNA